MAQGFVPAAPPVPARLIFGRFWPYARPLRAWIGLALVLVVAGPAIEAAQIWMLKLLVDEVLVPRDFGPFGPLALATAGLGLLGGAVSFSDTFLSNWIAQRFLLELRASFFGHLQTLSLDFFERRRLGDLLARLTDDIGSIENLVVSGIVDAFAYATRILYFVGVLLYLQVDLAVVSLGLAPLFWLAARRFAGGIKQASREKRRLSGSLTAVAEESLANAALVQAYNQQGTELQRFRRQCHAVFDAQMVATRLRALYAPVVDLAQLAGILAVVGVGTWELASDRMSLGALLAFVAYLSQLYSPVRGLSRLGSSLFAAAAAAERIIEFLDQSPAVPEPRRPISFGPASGHIVLEHVSFCYPGAPRPALADVSFEVRPGQTLALVGASGAGKSTVAKLLLRFYDPSFGRILLDGHDLRDLALHSLRDQVTLLLQETLIFDGSIRENIAYGRPDAREAQIIDAARRADAHAFITSLPDHYDTLVGQRGRRLSGGQRQRIAIARAMLRDAPVLVLDEPTTGLDAESGWRVLEPLRRLMSGRTTLIISHNLATVSEASHIVVLDTGKVVESGTHLELLVREGVYARLHRFHQGQPGLVSSR